jgi:5'-3' exonuclease
MILVDGSSLLHRVLNTEQAELTDSHGRYTGGLHGFLISLGSVCLKYRLKHQVIVAWDLGIPLFRREIYREYKSHKVPIGNVADQYKSEANLLEREGEDAPNEWLDKYLMSRNLLNKKFLPNTGCLSVQVVNCEADDIIAYVCHKIKDEEIIILSTDRDLVQLLNSDRSFYDGRTQTTLMVEDIISTNHLEKSNWHYHWMLTRAICGDASDGIPGIGPGWDHAIEYARQIIKMKITLKDALPLLERVPRGRQAGYESIKNGYNDITRNMRLMDLDFPIRFNLPIINDIRTQFATCSINPIAPDVVESDLHELQMNRAKASANSIIESNSNFDPIEYTKRLGL